jgi:hypothetical protein
VRICDLVLSILNTDKLHWIGIKRITRYFQIFTHELTGSTSLQITDFAEANEKHDSIDLWDTQIETLKRTLGI